MVRFRRALPSVNALVTFEAAARLKSFTAAARELGVTQAAVSRQIRLLEDDFGVALFRRGHRRVEPTPAGGVLGTTLSSCFQTITETVAVIRQPQEAETLTVGATVAFSHFWLLPRLSAFRKQHPDLPIRIISQDAAFDIASGEIDVVMRYGIPPFADGEVVASATDVVYPVASASFAAGLDRPPTLQDLLAMPLIATDAWEPSWFSWGEWFERAGAGTVAPRIALRFSNYTDGIYAALAGQGVALGWDLQVARFVAARQLVRLTDAVVAPEASYSAVIPRGSRRSATADAFVTWVRQAPEHNSPEET
jgi:LysR family glycine cleavage system transcriptional activator